MKLGRARLALLIFASEIAGCATVIHGTTQQVRFESTPAGATATAGSQTITTPGELKLPRDRPCDVTMEKSGYIPAHTHIGQVNSGAVWGNVLLGGLIGIVVDYSNGAAYELEPTVVSTVLIPDPSAAPPIAVTDPPPVPSPTQHP